MFYRSLIIFSALLMPSFSPASDSGVTEPPVEVSAEVQGALVAIGTKFLERNVKLAELFTPSHPSPRTPTTSIYEDFCVRVMVLSHGKEVLQTLEVTPSIHPLQKSDSPDSKNFFSFQDINFDFSLFPFEQAPSQHSAVTLRVWENRNLMVYFVHGNQLNEAFSAVPTGEESFEKALYKERNVQDSLKDTDYFRDEMNGLKRAWKYLYDDFMILTAAINGEIAPPRQCVLNIADRFPVYERRLGRYLKSFKKTTPREET